MPEGREKPFGTGHALLCCKDVVDAPFAVINADDYYGPKAFQMLYDYLTTHEDDDLYRYVMIAFHIEKTITENGHVSRGVCQVDKNHYLKEITERTRIEKRVAEAAFTLDDGATWTPVPDKTPVSMNCWGFTPGFLKVLEDKFPAFLDKGLKENPMKCEYFLPSVVEELLKEKLREKGLKVTNQRILILSVLEQNKGRHLTAEDIYELVTQEHPEIGLATVYRTIQLLWDMQLIDKINLDEGCVRYEIGHLLDGGSKHNHHHLICRTCNKIIPFDDDLLEEAERHIERTIGFHVLDHEVKFYGICRECMKKGK